MAMLAAEDRTQTSQNSTEKLPCMGIHGYTYGKVPHLS